MRPPIADRNFPSEPLEEAIRRISADIAEPELASLFSNCLPNTLDTTVHFEIRNGRPDTYVITGDINAMWLRDSTAQVWPYLRFAEQDPRVKQMLAGVIYRQTEFVLKDPYANAFYLDPCQRSRHANDATLMLPGVHERKWEIDSLCYVIRLACAYWKRTGDSTPFDARWKVAMELVLRTFREQQRKQNPGPYTFLRPPDHSPPDWKPPSGDPGFGDPVNPVGLICSRFRPSDDACTHQFLVPSNLFAVSSLRQLSEMVRILHADETLSGQCEELADEVERAVWQHAVVEHPEFGRILAYEIDGFGGVHLMDDANVPNLLGLPYLGIMENHNPVYAATRRFVLSTKNPYYFEGKAARGLGSPHGRPSRIWHLGIIVQALTSDNPEEIRECLHQLCTTHANTGFMHEGFDKDDPTQFTRRWFAWANTLFGELILDLHETKPELLKEKLL